MLRKCAHTKGAFSADFFAASPCFLPFISPYCGAPPPGGGVVLGLFGWGCAAGILEPYTIPDLVQLNFATLY